MSGLKPCPKCGSTNLYQMAFWDTFDADHTIWRLMCEDCGHLWEPCWTDVALPYLRDLPYFRNRRAGAAHDEPAP